MCVVFPGHFDGRWATSHGRTRDDDCHGYKHFRVLSKHEVGKRLKADDRIRTSFHHGYKQYLITIYFVVLTKKKMKEKDTFSKQR
jgi:hypothetical protein